MIENNEKNKDVYKEHLLGFVLVKTKYNTPEKGGLVDPNRLGATHFIHPEPITAAIDCYEGISGLYQVNLRPDNDEIVGIIPAQSGSLAVYLHEESGCELIGYEFPGVEHPDWNNMIKSIKKMGWPL